MLAPKLALACLLFAGCGPGRVEVRLVDGNGNPVAHAPVDMRLAPRDGSKKRYETRRTDARGLAIFYPSSAGTLRVLHDGYNVFSDRGTTIEFERFATIDLSLPGKLHCSGRLERAPSDLGISLFSGVEHEDYGIEIRHTELGPSGAFLFSGLEPGPYRIEMGLRPNSLSADTLAAYTFELLESRDDLNLVYDRPHRLGGRITGLEEGIAPWVTLKSKEPGIHRLTQSRTFSWKLPPGPYEISVTVDTEEGQSSVASIGYEHTGDLRDLEIDVRAPTVWVELDPADVFRERQPGHFQLIAENGHRPPEQAWSLGKMDAPRILPRELGQVRIAHHHKGMRYALENLTHGRWVLKVHSVGCETFRTTFDTRELVDEHTIRAPLPRLAGRVVQNFGTPGDRSEIFVGSASARSVAHEWQRLLWDSGERWSHTPLIGNHEAHLAPGTYDFRRTSDRNGETSWGPIVIEDDPEPLKLVPPEER